MNGYAPPPFEIVNAEDNSMGGVVEGGAGNVDDNSPRKATIEKVQAELRQKYSALDETKRELDFLEKGGDLLDYKLPYGTSVSVQSTSVADQQNERLLSDEAKGCFAFVASSHGDSVESTGEPRVAPSEANSVDNLRLFDAETEFSEGGRSSSRPCSSDFVPVEQPFHVNETKKYADSTASDLPRKAYKRRYRSRPSREGARSSSVDVDPAHGIHGASLSSRQGSRDIKGLESEGEKHNNKLIVLLKSTGPVEGTCVRNETPADAHHNDLDVSKSIGYMEDTAEGVSRPAELDSNVSAELMNKKLIQEPLSGAARTPYELGFCGPEGIQAIEKKSTSVADNQLVLNCLTSKKVDNPMPAHEMNGSKWRQDGENRNDVQNSGSQGVGVLNSQLICSTTGRNIDNNNSNEMWKKVQNVDPATSKKNQNLLDGPSGLDTFKSVTTKKDAEEVSDLSLLNQKTDYGNQHVRESGSLLQSGEGLVESGSDSKNRLLDQVVVEKRDACGCELSELNRKNGHPVLVYPDTHQRIESTHADYVDEESILKEAQIIEAKRRRIADLSVVISSAENQQRSQWCYVLEEMVWLSNDFSQERMWKTAAAAQISSQATVACRLRREKKTSGKDAKIIAQTLAKAVLEFWHSFGETKEILLQKSPRNEPIRAYAARIFISHKPNTLCRPMELPLSPDRTSDQGLPDLSRDNLAYENIFYAVPFGAMETYRKLVMSHVAQIERVGSYVQEEAEMSACDGTTDFEFQDNPYDEDEGETSTFNMPVAFESSKSHGYGRKKLKNLKRGHGMWSYEVGSDVFHIQSSEIKVVNQHSGLLEKRPGSSLNVSIPTKRVRTAFRRIISPFSAGPAGSFQFPNKTDASSGDTSSLQDDHSTLRGGLAFPNALEVESAGDFEKQSPFVSADVSMMPKKKKRKNKNAPNDHRWQFDYSSHEQRDHLKRRSEGHLPESNGNSGLFGQPPMKKPKVARQSRDNLFDNRIHSSGSVPSPVASQLSNMHNPNKFVKMLSSRDRGRNVNGLKIPGGQPGSGIPWSVFEDQALVVLVHDLGPNWELISDAFNSTLQFKCVFRNAKECKERHYVLMDRTSADGADSTEDSGSSQPYPSTLPGIPKGSARQLFQRLQGPMEEDTLKSHFEKIIVIGQKVLHRRSQEPKQLQKPHVSHLIVPTQVCPNNLNGGPILTPLDLCDVVQGPDMVPTGLQTPHTNGPVVSNPGIANASLHSSGASSAIQGSPNMIAGSSFSSSPGPVSSSVRDGRHVVPRCAPLSADEQQKFHPYNHMMPGRNVTQACLPANRSFPVARPGFQGTTTAAPMVNSGSTVSPAVSPNVHSGVATSYGSSLSRSRDALHLSRPEFHMPGNGQGMSHFGGLSAPTASPTVSSSQAVHHPPPLPVSPQRPNFQGTASPQHQAFTLRLAKERQLQQRLMMQQQFAGSPVQTSTQVQSHKSLPVPLSTISQKHPASGVADHTGKQPSRQQFTQSSQQGPQLQAQQKVKVVKSAISNGASSNPGNQPLDTIRPSHPRHVMQSVSQSFSQQKIHSGQGSSASKHIQTTQSDSSNQVHASSAGASGSHPRHVLESQQKHQSHIQKSVPTSQTGQPKQSTQTQQQPQLLQAGIGNSNEKPSDTRLERTS